MTCILVRLVGRIIQTVLQVRLRCLPYLLMKVQQNPVFRNFWWVRRLSVLLLVDPATIVVQTSSHWACHGRSAAGHQQPADRSQVLSLGRSMNQKRIVRPPGRLPVVLLNSSWSRCGPIDSPSILSNSESVFTGSCGSDGSASVSWFQTTMIAYRKCMSSWLIDIRLGSSDH